MDLVLTDDRESLRKSFYDLESPRDIAKLLRIEYSQLIYHLHHVDPSFRYHTFEISKRSGGKRTISAPANALKIIQQKLNQVFVAIYRRKPPVHGFVEGKNIVTNASLHSKKRLILRVDLENFFPTINFGRVRGMFMAYPYNRNAKVATFLAKICCHENVLPQGAPTSPMVSNMICSKMDNELLRLAKTYRVTYTRYADDLVFSTTEHVFRSAICSFDKSTKKFGLGLGFQSIISANGFKINIAKVHLRHTSQRQLVTGLVVNRFPNVRRSFLNQIRAMLHALKKFGLGKAEDEFKKKPFYKKHRAPFIMHPSFLMVLRGKIEFLGQVRGKSNSTYNRFRKELQDLVPDLVKDLASPEAPGATSLVPLHTGVFSFKPGPVDGYQLTLDIEDDLGLRLLPFTDGEYAEGWLDVHGKTVSVRLCQENKEADSGCLKRLSRRQLSSEELERLKQIVGKHEPRPLTFLGEMGQVVTRYSESVGRIIVQGEDREKFATGFLIGADLLLTAAHVVDPTKVRLNFIEFDRVEVRGNILFCDTDLDVAILKLDREIAARPIVIRHDIEMPRDRGMQCVAIGYPDEPGYKPDSQPIELKLSGLKESYLLKHQVLSLSVALGSGMSGSPILNARRSLVGMVIGFPSEDETPGTEKSSHGTAHKIKWSAAAVSCADLKSIVARFI